MSSLIVSSITTTQFLDCLLAILALLPAMMCAGYIFAWFTNFFDFRSRSFIERIFWSIPLSISISAIASELIGRYASLSAVVIVLAVSFVIWAGVLIAEGLHSPRSERRVRFRPGPYAGVAIMLAVTWTFIAIFSLVDIESNHKLYMSATVFDQAYRVSWIESVQRTGIPPMNALYFFKDPSPLRTFYFWYVLGAAGATLMHVPARAVLIASSVWAGFGVSAIIGLYLKHFLQVGAKLRRQFVIAVSLLGVTGLDLVAVFITHKGITADLEWWSHGQIASWFDSLLWVPHHVASLVCCMFALLVASLGEGGFNRNRMISLAVIAMALASAFGISIFVSFAFFVVMAVWCLWRAAFQRTAGPSVHLLLGGMGTAVLLAPFLSDLAHSPSGNGQRIFSLAVREMLPPDPVLRWPFVQHLALTHPGAGSNLANLILLVPGYVFELGFYLLVLVVFLIPFLRGRTPLSQGQRSLVFLASVTLPLISFVRSWVLQTNDFGWRGALILQFALLLLASGWLSDWTPAATQTNDGPGPPRSSPTPRWFRFLAISALVIGLAGTTWQVFWLRFFIPVAEAQSERAIDPAGRPLSRDAWIAWFGYRELGAAIRPDAVVQYNPHNPNQLGVDVDLLNIDRQVAMFKDNGFKDQLQCGSVWGGDPSGCRDMENAIDSMYTNATADQARETCRRFGIEYLVVRKYDPVWPQKLSWVWTLPAAVNHDDFRALDCRR